MSEQQQKQQAPEPSIGSTVDDLGPCKKLVRVEVPAAVVDRIIDGVTADFQKHAQLPGFRAGKAPRHLIVKSFGSRIDEEAKKKVLEESFRSAAEQHKFRVLVTSNLEEQTFSRGMPFLYNINCEIAPSFETPDYKGLPARREISVASDADVQRAINILRDQQVKYNDVARAVQDGDVVVVNYRGAIEGKPLTDFAPTARGLTEKQNFWLAIAKDSFLPGFTEALIGASAGEKRSVAVTFPAEFVAPELSGKAATFEVEIVGVKEKLLPEVNEEFAKGFGAAGVDELLAGVRRDLQNELDSRQKASVRDQILKALMARVEFELPESLLHSETRNLVYNIVNQNQRRGVAAEVIEQKKDEIMANASASARERVKAGFILDRIAEAEKIGVDQREVVQRIAALAQANNTTPEKLAKKLQEQNQINELAHEIRTGKVLDFLELVAQIEEVPVTRA